MEDVAKSKKLNQPPVDADFGKFLDVYDKTDARNAMFSTIKKEPKKEEVKQPSKPLKSFLEPAKPTYDFTKRPEQNKVLQSGGGLLSVNNAPIPTQQEAFNTIKTMPKKVENVNNYNPITQAATEQKEKVQRMYDSSKGLQATSGYLSGILQGTGAQGLLKLQGNNQAVQDLDFAAKQAPITNAAGKLVGAIIPTVAGTKGAGMLLNPVLGGAGKINSAVAIETLAGAGLGLLYSGGEKPLQSAAEFGGLGAIGTGAFMGIGKGISGAKNVVKDIRNIGNVLDDALPTPSNFDAPTQTVDDLRTGIRQDIKDKYAIKPNLPKDSAALEFQQARNLQNRGSFPTENPTKNMKNLNVLDRKSYPTENPYKAGVVKPVKTPIIDTKTNIKPIEPQQSKSSIISRMQEKSALKSNVVRKMDNVNAQPSKVVELAEEIMPKASKQIKSATTLTGKQKISQARTNTIERTMELAEDTKKYLPDEEFGYEPQTKSEWEGAATNNFTKNKQSIVDDLLSDKPSDGGRKTFEAAMVVKEAEAEAIKTGKFDKLLSYTKKYAEKIREDARALKAHDLAWEKGPTIGNTIRKAQQIVDNTQEQILKASPKLKAKLESDLKSMKDTISKAVQEATGETMKTFRLNLQLFAGKVKPESLEKLIGKHFSTDPLKRGEIVDSLVKQFGLDGDEAKVLADRINRVFEQKFHKSAESYLRRLLKSEKKQDPTLEKVMKLIRAGAYDDVSITSALKEKYGLPVLTADEAKKIVADVDKLNSLSKNTDDYNIQLAKIRRMIEDKQAKTWVDKQRAIKNLALLWNPTSIATNIAGNVGLGGLDIASSSTLGNVVDRLLSLRTGNRTVGVSNIKQLLTGAKKGAIDATVDMAGGLRLKDLEGLTPKQRVAAVIDGMQNPIQRPIFEQTENKFELMRGISFKGKNKLQISNKEAVRKIGEFTAKGGKVGRVLENQLYYALGAPDRMAKQAHFDDTLNMLMKLNKTSEATDDMKRLAEQIALERTFTDVNTLSSLGKWVQSAPAKLKDNPKIARTIEFAINSVFPYMTTPLNIAKRSIEYSPLGLIEGLSQMGRALAKPEGITLAKQRYIADRVSRGIAGTMLFMLGVTAYDKGLATGKTSKNYDMSSFMNDLKVYPNSLKIGDLTIDLTKLQPIATSFISGVNLEKSKKEGIEKGDKDAKFDATENLLNSVGDAFEFYTDMPIIQGLKKLLPSNRYGQTTSDAFTDFIMSVPQQYFPSMLKKAAFVSDDSEREVYDPSRVQEKLINPFKKSTPGVRESLPQKYGTLGQETKTYGGNNSFWNVYFNPIKVGKSEPTPVQNEVMRLYDATNSTSVFPNVADKFVEFNGKRYLLTGEQKSQYQQIMGENIEKTLSELFSMPRYQGLEDTSEETGNTKVNAVRKAIENSKAIAEKEMAKELGVEIAKKKRKKPMKIKIPNQRDADN